MGASPPEGITSVPSKLLTTIDKPHLHVHFTIELNLINIYLIGTWWWYVATY